MGFFKYTYILFKYSVNASKILNTFIQLFLPKMNKNILCLETCSIYKIFKYN